MQNEFLIKLDRNSFFTLVDKDGDARGTPFPNCAAAMTYSDADKLCREFREQGFSGAIVVDRFAQPVLPIEIRAERRYSIKIRDRYFAGRDVAGRVLSSPLAADAYSLSKPIAVEIQRRLQEVQYPLTEIVFNQRGRIAVIDELVEVWGDDSFDARPVEEAVAPEVHPDRS